MPSPTQEKVSRFAKIGYVTCAEAAKLADVDKKTVSNWACKRLIESIKDGMYLFVYKPDVEKLIPEIPARKALAESIKRKGEVKRQLPRALEKYPSSAPNSLASNPKQFLEMLKDPMVQKELETIVKRGIVLFTMSDDETPKV